MVCTFYHKDLGCTTPYCYYPKSPEITCGAKEKMLNEVGIIYRESPTDKPLINQAQPYRKYPKQY